MAEEILAAVTDEFERYLHRDAENGAVHYFTGLLDAGGDAALVDAVIVSSPEYLAIHEGDDQFVDTLFGDALRRPVDAVARKFFDDLLAQGVTQAQIADIVFGSEEYRRDVVSGWYEHYLDRAADAAQIAPFLAQLDAGVPGEQVIAVMLATDEFAGKTT